MTKDHSLSDDWLQSIHGICFDLDNTLYDRDAAARSVFASWLAEMPTKLLDLEEIMERDAHGYSDRPDFFSWLNNQLDCKDLWKRFQQEIPSAASLPSSAQNLLTILRERNIPCSILTNGGAVQWDKIESLRLVKFIPKSHIFVSSEIEVAKPDPRSFALVADRLALPPKNILMVGDHLEFDIRGAKEAGFSTCWLSQFPTEPCHHADLIIYSLEELTHFARKTPPHGT